MGDTIRQVPGGVTGGQPLGGPTKADDVQPLHKPQNTEVTQQIADQAVLSDIRDNQDDLQSDVGASLKVEKDAVKKRAKAGAERTKSRIPTAITLEDFSLGGAFTELKEGETASAASPEESRVSRGAIFVQGRELSQGETEALSSREGEVNGFVSYAKQRGVLSVNQVDQEVTGYIDRIKGTPRAQKFDELLAAGQDLAGQNGLDSLSGIGILLGSATPDAFGRLMTQGPDGRTYRVTPIEKDLGRDMWVAQQLVYEQAIKAQSRR